jgi:uncharacterized BrkB/YihY/UPF0761 family membrane protein
MLTVVQGAKARADAWQRGNRLPGVAYGVVKKFGDDRANQYVIALGWYGFVAIYPLLLAVTTILASIGAASLGYGLVSTLHQFPVVGSEFNPAHGSSNLHGNVLALVVGLAGMIYGAQGVTQTAQAAMAQVWNVSPVDSPGFLAKLVRSLIGLAIIGGSLVVNAPLAALATGSGTSSFVRPLLLVGMVVLNAVLYLAAFRVLSPRGVHMRQLVPGAVLGSLGFTVLITVGSGLIQHQLRNSSATYGQFGVVVGLVGFLFLLAKISLYGAELNTVLDRRLWPRGLVSTDPTPADDQVLRDIVHQDVRRPDQRVGVGFGEDASDEAARDAERDQPERTPGPAADQPLASAHLQ